MIFKMSFLKKTKKKKNPSKYDQLTVVENIHFPPTFILDFLKD